MTIHGSLLGGVACALVAASFAAAAPTPAPSLAKVTINGLRAHLGEALQAWRDAPPPAGLAGYDRVCRSEQWRPLSRLMAPAPQPVTACTWAKTYGSVTIGPSLRLEPGDYDVRQVTWYFSDGRLADIAADITPNAYDAVVQALEHDFGPAVETVRRTASSADGPLPQVSLGWRGGGGVATVIDPAPPKWDLQLVVGEQPLPAGRTVQAPRASPPHG